MAAYNEYGNGTLIITSGAACLTSANAQIIGVLFQSTATAAIQLWQGITATGASTNAITGIVRGWQTTAATAQQSIYLPIPAYCSGGITYNVGAASDVRITLFWNPVGGA